MQLGHPARTLFKTCQIEQIINQTTNCKAAKRLGITRPRLNDLLRGKISKFSDLGDESGTCGADECEEGDGEEGGLEERKNY